MGNLATRRRVVDYRGAEFVPSVYCIVRLAGPRAPRGRRPRRLGREEEEEYEEDGIMRGAERLMENEREKE